MATNNPFAPTFGVTPPLLVGRDDIIEDFTDALAAGPGAPERALLITGLRGTGKTVMINALEDAARSSGWLVISESATPGLADRVTHEHLPALLAQHDPRQGSIQVTGASLAAVGSVDVEVADRHQPRTSLRSQLTMLADLMHERNEGGVLITVDEVHRKQISDLRALGTVVQHLFREGRSVAFVGAGLPMAVSDLLSDEVTTFLRRADRRHLGSVAPDDVERALRIPIERLGHDITDQALAIATRGTDGYPFMIQLVGWHAWLSARGSDVIDADAARRGAEKAARKVGALVHAPSLHDLSDVDRSFLAAMAHDDGPSRMGDIAERLGVENRYVGVYRRRLLDAGIIHAPRYGYVDYTLPHLREYLREHAASVSWDPRVTEGP